MRMQALAMVLVLGFVLAILAGCAPQLPIEPSLPPSAPRDEPLRPDIPRSPPPIDTTPSAEQPQGSEVPPVVPDPIPRITLEVPLGEPIGRTHPRITALEFPLLRHPVIERTAGVPVQYDEEILFWDNGTGKVVFGDDNDGEEIGTFLLFEEDETMFEYRAILRGATFEQLQGRQIQLLGHTYVISEADNDTVVLFGTTVAGNLLFSNGSKLVVDDERRQDTDVRVLPSMIAYRVIAHGDDNGGDILLSPGEDLASNIGQEKFASKFLNIRYDGIDLQEFDRIELDTNRFGYSLTLPTPLGDIEIPLLERDASRLVLGRAGERLHIRPCPDRTYCIAPGEMVLLVNPDGVPGLFSYSDLSENPAELILRSTHNEYHYDIVGNLSKDRDAWTQVPVDGYAFKVRIGPRDNATGARNLSIEMPRDPVIVTPGDLEVRLGTLRNETFPIEVHVPAERTRTHRIERIAVNLSYDGNWRAAVFGNATFVSEEDTDFVHGTTPYGAALTLEREDGGWPLHVGETLSLLVPVYQAMARVRLEG